MPTRGLVAVKYDDIFVGIANNFDSYFKGLGLEVLRFIILVNKNEEWYTFKKNLKEIDIIKTKYEPKPSINIKIYKEHVEIEPLLPRCDTEDCRFLYMIYYNLIIKLPNEIEFGNDGLMCEYGYILNLDNNKLEIYIGNKPNYISKKIGLFENKLSYTFVNNGKINNYYSIQKILEYPLHFENVKDMLEKVMKDYQNLKEKIEKKRLEM